MQFKDVYSNGVYVELIIFGFFRIQIVKNDITQENNTIVNAANSQLIHAGGVAASIAKSAGGKLQ